MIRRVAVLGSSISMLVRPIAGLPYPRVLERLLNDESDDVWIVDNRSRIAATVDDLPTLLPQVIADRPDVVVIHYGHVEPIFRPHSRREWYGTFGINLGDSRVQSRMRQLRRFVARGRQRLRLLEQWTPLDRFELVLRDSLAYLRKETTASVVVVEANPGNSKIEAWGPGSMDAIARCNAMMRRAAGESGARWLDLESALGIPIGDAAPDGTHFTAEAHAALADALAKLIQADRTAGSLR